jgi:hypothetical protein
MTLPVQHLPVDQGHVEATKSLAIVPSLVVCAQILTLRLNFAASMSNRLVSI